CELGLVMLVKSEASLIEAKRPMPRHALRLPVLEPFHVRLAARRLRRIDEELHLHLLELARAKDEVPRRDLIAECLADLRDAERDFLSRRLLDVHEVDEDSLRGFRTKIDDRGALLDRSHERLEHEIEEARLAECALHPARGTL